MEKEKYLSKFKISKRSPVQSLADEIYEYFGKKIPYGELCGLIKMNGVLCSRELFEETKKTGAKDHLALFVWRMKKEKTIWQNS